MVNEFEEENQEILLALSSYSATKITNLKQTEHVPQCIFWNYIEILFWSFKCDMKNKIHCGKKIGDLQIISSNPQVFGFLWIAKYESRSDWNIQKKE